METKKRCIKCNEIKPLDQFERKQSCRDGHINVCKKCILDRRHELRPLKNRQTHRVVNGVKQKWCSKCEQWKDESEFHKNRARPDGLHATCKECISPLPKGTYVARSDIRECDENGILTRRKCKRCKKWKDISYYDKESAVCRDCHLANRRRKKRVEFISTTNGIYVFNEDGIMVQAKCRRCKKFKPIDEFPSTTNKKKFCFECAVINRRESIINASRSRRTRERNVLSTLNDTQWQWLLELCDYKCIVEGCDKPYEHQDHVIPLCPGTHTLDNVQPLCERHNLKKHRRYIDYRPDWLKRKVRKYMRSLGLKPLTKRQWDKLVKDFESNPSLKMRLQTNPIQPPLFATGMV